MNEIYSLDSFSALLTSYLLIIAAEMGDKSQLVCMVLAARYTAIPVLIGASLSFIVLNTLAVIFGAGIAQWIPEFYLSLIVALLFAGFGIHALRATEESEEETEIRSVHHLLWGTFFLITVAEFGDKTQLAVVALSTTYLPIAVWAGATLALISTSILGVWAGQTLLQKIPIVMLHRISGVIFLALAIVAGYQAYSIR